MKPLLIYLCIAFFSIANGAEPKPTHQLDIKGLIDDTDEFTVQNGKLTIHHIAWSLPLKLVINDKKWTPTWKDNQTEAFDDFDPELASFVDAKVEIHMYRGRGEALILEQPTNHNNYKLVFRLHDNGEGASDFYVRLTWETEQDAAANP
jgi:hypothetical protein